MCRRVAVPVGLVPRGLGASAVPVPRAGVTCLRGCIHQPSRPTGRGGVSCRPPAMPPVRWAHRDAIDADRPNLPVVREQRGGPPSSRRAGEFDARETAAPVGRAGSTRGRPPLPWGGRVRRAGAPTPTNAPDRRDGVTLRATSRQTCPLHGHIPTPRMLVGQTCPSCGNTGQHVMASTGSACGPSRTPSRPRGVAFRPGGTPCRPRGTAYRPGDNPLWPVVRRVGPVRARPLYVSAGTKRGSTS